MNKKFSTLVAALLLSGALVSVHAESKTPSQITAGITASTGSIVFTGNVDLQNDWLEITEDNVTIDGQGYTLNGRIVIKGNGCTVKNLNIVLANKAGNDTQQKTAITVAAKSVSILNNKITCSAEGEFLANAISIFPLADDASIKVEGNTIIGANPKVSTWQSAGIMVVQGFEKSGLYNGTSSVLTDFAVTSINNNTFEDCAADYVVSDYTSGSSTYNAVRVSPLYKNGKFENNAYLNALVNNTAEDADVIFNGTSEEFLKGLAESCTEDPNKSFNNENSRVQCSDKSLLFGNATGEGSVVILASDGKVTTAATFTQAKAEVAGLALYENKTSDYGLLIITNAAGNWLVGLNGRNEATVLADITEENVGQYATDPKCLWKMEEGKYNDKVYYTFTNQEGTKLKTQAGAQTGTDGNFYPSTDNATYDKGVVFSLEGTDLKTNALNYFGLYKSGNKILSVKDLNWFEQNGFSVTIKYEDKDGDFTMEDIAGNPFAGHLTPMTWNSTTTKFVVATDNATSFYLRDADGKYIVAQKYASNGSVPAQATYTFKTIAENDLAHDLARSEGEYFGEFKAEVAAKYTDYKKLEAIDVLKVNLPAGWAEVGRLDLGTKEVPTLASSVATELKPILVSLGSNEVVDATKFLQKGKFYTVERIASTDKTVKLGKLAIAGDEYKAEFNFVKSYGNVLEGQWALTIKDGYYNFTNRETPEASWKLFPVSALYYTDKDNIYRCGTDTYLIEAVEEHSATDGYSTLADVKNNKFYIGFSSDVFNGNAWFVENHEGTKNHTIGLNIEQDDALIFTATEYAAARDRKENKDHSYTYIPSDSIYVISTLGYFDAKKNYKETLDTLKVVSYSFVNQYTEPLIYNSDEDKYESDVYADKDKEERYETVAEAAKVAQKFALRLDGNKLNLRPVSLFNEAMTESQYGQLGDALMCQYFNYWYKVYAGDATKGILNNEHLYSRTENDLFVVEPTEKPMYRPVVNALDTISIFRNDNPKSILFEDGIFLGMENLAQYPEIAPAMVADTAYVRNNTYRPQYMLVVEPKITPAGKWCPIHGDDPTCPDAHKVESKGWVEGRYLVNLVDTAIAWDIANKHKDNNPYINTEKYYRLGFVQAKHIEDSLVIASTNDTLMVGTEDYNQAKFAFRYVDTDAKSFRIETANYKRLPGVDEAVREGEGYVKWMNGVVVVVDDIVDGDVFNMNEEETGLPTANDAINGVAAFSVSTTDGAVIVKGAEGKNVVITNVLGQTVASTVITSSEATISVPAGVVVVAVEGEAAVKAIVK